PGCRPEGFPSLAASYCCAGISAPVAECHTFWEFIRLKIKEIEMAERLQSDYRGGGMALAKITRQGLGSMAILVAVLWACILSERYLSRNSRIETYRALRD